MMDLRALAGTLATATSARRRAGLAPEETAHEAAHLPRDRVIENERWKLV